MELKKYTRKETKLLNLVQQIIKNIFIKNWPWNLAGIKPNKNKFVEIGNNNTSLERERELKKFLCPLKEEREDGRNKN